MSVPEGKRGKSEMEFVTTARELQIYTMKKCVGFPKRYTFFISEKISDLAQDIHHHVKMGNSINPLNEHEVQMRRDHFLTANAELYSLTSQIEVADEAFGVGEKVMNYWSALIDKEETLIKGILKSDRERYKKFDQKRSSEKTEERK